jgi:hypothetical protein
MQDVTERFIAARSHGAWPVTSLLTAHAVGNVFAGLRVEWDEASGEEWLRVLKTSMVLGLVWIPGPLVIETSGHQEIAAEVASGSGVTPQIVVVPHMDSPVLCVRPDDVWLDREWPAGAIDANALSAHDLWYATC